MSKRDSSTRKIEKQGEPERKKKKGKAEEPVNPSEPSRPAITFPIAQLTTEAFAAHSLPDPEEDQQPGAQALSKDGIPGIIADESFDTIKETLEALRPSWSPHTTNSKAIGLLAYPRLLIRPHNVDVEEIPKSEELFRSKRDALSMLKRCMLAAKTTPKVSSTEVAGMKSIEFLPLDNPFSWSWTKLAAFLLRFNSVPNLFTISTKNRNEPIVDKNGTRAIEAVPVERIEGPLHYLIQALRASGTGHAITHIGEVGVGSLVPLTLATSYACGQLGLRRDFYISQFIVALIQKGDPSHLASGGSVLGSSASHVTMGSLASKTSFFGNPQGEGVPIRTPLTYNCHYMASTTQRPSREEPYTIFPNPVQSIGLLPPHSEESLCNLCSAKQFTVPSAGCRRRCLNARLHPCKLAADEE